MSLSHYWVNPSCFKIVEVETGREQTITVPGADLLERDELEDIVLAMMEEAESDFKEPENPPLSRDQQRDLGGVLMDIRASNRYKQENNHSRYW